jgi:hypothetical protein
MILELLLATAIGAAMGAGALFLWTSHETKTRKRIPRVWPLQVRPLLSSKELRVWTWLCEVMSDHQVIVKVPVTRFTSPLPSEDATTWYELLNGVYCTFTVCDQEGKVLGCLDLQGPQSRNASNQALKYSLLSQCDIRYWVVDPAQLPSSTHIRSGLLGEKTVKLDERALLEMQFNDVRDNLQTAVTRQRGGKNGPTPRPEAEINTQVDFSDSRMNSGWDANSFVTPLDSRTAPLQK